MTRLLTLHRSSAVALAFILAGLGASTARAQVVIPDSFEQVLPVDAADTAERMAKCVGQSQPAAVKAWLEATPTSQDWNETREYAPADGKSMVISAKGWWTCLALSPSRLPIYPLEVLTGTIVANGVSKAAMADWQRNLLQVLAERGEARGMIVYTNGNAMSFEFKASANTGNYLRYTNKFLKADVVDEAGYHAVLRDPGMRGMHIYNSVDAARPDFKGQLAIPMARSFWPMDGEFVKAPAGPANTGFAFENTKWSMDKGSTLFLQPNGVSLLSTSRSTSNGTWEARDGVAYVRFDSGLFYTLRVSMDGKTMEGRARNTPPKTIPAGMEDVLAPRHWKATLTAQ